MRRDELLDLARSNQQSTPRRIRVERIDLMVGSQRGAIDAAAAHRCFPVCP
jgi:hypothetical protein